MCLPAFLSQDYVVTVTEEFLEFISDGALAVEVWGHRCAGNGSPIWEVDSLHAKTRTLHDRFVLAVSMRAGSQDQLVTISESTGFKPWGFQQVVHSLRPFPPF